jgi:hypothetical protein
MYTNSQNKVIIQNLDNEAWFTRINSRLTLPYKVSGRRALCIWTEQNSAG